MPTLVLLRHGQSQWNLENRFTGWWDVDLSDQGVAEARAAGALMREKRLRLRLLLHQRPDPRHPHAAPGAARDGPAVASGGQGLAPQRAPLWRADRPQQAGDDRQGRGRAGQDLAPLLRHPAAALARRQPVGRQPATAATPGSTVPRTESLKDTIARALPYYHAEIEPALRAGKRVLISAHGNSLRGIIKYLSDIGDEEIVGLEIPTGQPIVYELPTISPSARTTLLSARQRMLRPRPLSSGTFPRRRGP